MTDAVKNIFLDAVPSIADDRDYRYSQSKIALKQSVDLREWDSTVDDQSYIGSCVGNAIANAYELTVRRLYPEKFVELSRLFIYYNSRLFDNSYKEDIGTYIRDGLKSAARYGICSEKLWPYIEENFDDQPYPECYVDASQRIVTRYETLYTLRDMLEIINDNRPIVIGLNLYTGFMEMNSTQSVVKTPRAIDRSIGSHAVVLVGYDLDRQLFLAKNSFGTEWGDQGYFWIPFEYVRAEVFEKWCFDISSQRTIDIDTPVNYTKPSAGPSQIMIETGLHGFTVKQISQEQSRTLYKTSR
jgi:C1A family cysteine protease